MTPGSNENQFCFRHSIKQKPIRLYMAIPMPGPVSAQWVGPASSWKRLLCLKQSHHDVQFVHVPALLPNPLQIFRSFSNAVVVRSDRGIYSLSRNSRKDRYRLRLAGLFASVMAAVVSALGIETGNGNPL